MARVLTREIRPGIRRAAVRLRMPSAAAVAAIALLLTAGCGSDGGTRSEGKGTPSPGASSSEPAAPVPGGATTPTGPSAPAGAESAPPAAVVPPGPAAPAPPDPGAPGPGRPSGPNPPAPGKATPPPPAPPAPPAPAPGKVQALPANAPFDYQIGAPYQPPAGVRVVLRDRGAQPLAGAYNVCYVNGFQAQPDATAWWEKNHPDLLLRDGGKPVMDADWGEALLDTSTPAKRAALLGVVGPWIDECAKKGFQAVEPDNLDSFGRSKGKLTLAHNAAFATLLAQRAHAAGVAIAQKNTVEMVDQRGAIGFDFAVSEECAVYDECVAFADAYANRVLVVEYARADFDKACRVVGSRVSVVLRDRNVTAPGSSSYVYAAC